MRGETNPDTLQTRRGANGSLIGLGLPWDQGLFIQEFWSQGRPSYAVANTTATAATLTLADWKGAAGRVLLGPWQIGAHSVEIHDVSGLVGGQPGALIAVMRAGELFGLLRAPAAFTLPVGFSGGVITVEGLNGTGDRNVAIYGAQPAAFVPADQSVDVRFSVPGPLQTVSLGEASPTSDMPVMQIREARGATLSVDRVGSGLVVATRGQTEGVPRDIELTLHAPAVSGQAMATLLGRVRTAAGGGFAFARGFVVRG